MLLSSAGTCFAQSTSERIDQQENKRTGVKCMYNIVFDEESVT